MKKSDLSIVIVSYNTEELLVACISSIVATIKKISYEIIVVDNASVDNTIEELKKLHIKNVTIIANTENYGFSKANNMGIRESQGRHVLFLNPDTVVYENTLDELVKFMDENPEVGASTCFVEMPNGKLDDASHRGFPTPVRALSHFVGLSKLFPKSKIFGGYNLSWKDLTKTHEIEACVGAFMLVRRSAGDAVGWWDEDFFWYGEDLDFCYRLKQKKWKIMFVPDFRILHYKGVSGGIKKSSQHLSIATDETRKRAINNRFLAMKLFYNKHYKGKYPSVLNLMVLSGIHFKWFMAKHFK